jgi:hypothetical protein
LKKNNPKFKTISATRSFNYFNLPALELDVEKISDKYKIIPYSENPDFYLDFDKHDLKKSKNKNLTTFQNRTKDSGKLFWRVKTDTSEMDFDISEEIILASKLSVEKYVKRIFVSEYESSIIIEMINKKYPNIEVIVIEGKPYYNKYKKYKKEKEKVLIEKISK